MRRRLYTVACALSLLLSIAAAVLWVRSYWQLDWWENRPGYGDGVGRTTRVYASRGRLVWETRGDASVSRWSGLVGLTRREFRIDFPFELYPHRRFVGCQIAYGYYPNYPSHQENGQELAALAVPLWAVTGLAALPPLLLLLRRVRETRRRRSGRCPVCGYDLRASTDRCPECGTPIPQEGAA